MEDFYLLVLLISAPELMHDANRGLVVTFPLMLIFAILAYSLRQYFYKEVRLIVDSDGCTITFYNSL